MEEKTIPLNKLKLCLLVAFHYLFVGAGAHTVYTAVTKPTATSGGLYALGIVLVVVFDLLGIAVIRKLFDRRPGLVLSPAGLFDNCTFVPNGLVPWSEITGIRLFEQGGRTSLIVKVADPRKYIVGGPLRRLFLRYQNHSYGSPVVISAAYLRIDVSLFLHECGRYGEMYAGLIPPSNDG